MLSFLIMTIKQNMQFIYDEINNKKIIHLIRWRMYDLVRHEFIFEKIQNTDKPFLVIEKFEDDKVSEDYHDLETIMIIIRWLLQIHFQIKTYKQGEFPIDRPN